MKYRCIVIDDEPLAIEIIKSHLSKFDMFELSASFSNAIEALATLSLQNTDLIFLDIQLPGIKGTDFLKQLISPPKVILTTAHREYALEGYELDVVDYVLKPISFERFTMAINKYLRQIHPPTANNYTNIDNDLNKQYIYLTVNRKVHKIFLNEIIYIESIKDYVTIHAEERKLIVKSTISAFEELLPQPDFMRIHRSFIVPFNKIKGFTSRTIDVGLTELPVGRKFHEPVFSRLKFHI